jgi:1,2-phenylacetyl-CoA epoxidase catalytic subunit
MLAEEEFHRDMGLAWLRRLGNGTPEARARLKEALQAAIPSSLAWLAPRDEAFATLAEAGLTASRDTLLERFEAIYGAALRSAGAEIPEPDFTGWDEARGRGPGQPREEVVERARGDRNRALLMD